MRILIRLAIAIIYLSAPVTLGAYGWGLYLVSEVVPLWLFLVIGVSNAITAISFAALLDRRQQSQGSPSRD